MAEPRPYPPSFLDRFMDFVQRGRVPYWLTYLILLIVQVTILHILAWMDGWMPVFTFNPIMAVFPIWLWIPMIVMTYVDSVALDALNSFRPLLKIEDEELNRLRYEFTTMPPRGVFLSGLFWGINYLLLTYLGYQVGYEAYGLDAFLGSVTFIVGLISYLTGSAIYYHSLRQLSLINRTVRTARQLNLFRLDPVYAFSRVTSLIGISWMLMLTLTLLTLPIRLATGLGLAIMAVQILLAIVAFVLPLWFVHRRLESEKLKLVAEHNLRVESTIKLLHETLDNKKLEISAHFNDAMASLAAEREVLSAIPTWPWRAGTLTGFLSAIVLPIIIFLIQFAVEKWLGG
ncbi:MAG: hypothetical protein C4583_07090 [Anaerolineaceae bacterium]|nr:MAG: hypothetical protein C4583_07090 [Anaerolineaceae bacterium]